MVPNGIKWFGLGKWQLEKKEKSKLRQILQFSPPLSDFTHLAVPRTCFFIKAVFKVSYVHFQSYITSKGVAANKDFHYKHQTRLVGTKVFVTVCSGCISLLCHHPPILDRHFLPSLLCHHYVPPLSSTHFQTFCKNLKLFNFSKAEQNPMTEIRAQFFQFVIEPGWIRSLSLYLCL